MADLKEIALTWFSAFNAHDLESLLDLYDDHAEHYSPKLKVHQPGTNGLIKGKISLRTWWADSFHRLPKLHYEIIEIITDNGKVFMEYIRQTPGEEDLRVGEVLVVTNGKIVSSSVYHS